MKSISNLSLEFGKQTKTYFDLLTEEDFDFKTKNIFITFGLEKDKLNVELKCNSVLELKIGLNALIKSLEVIDKTLEI